MLMPNLPVCIRLDGKAFHAWTSGLERPFDARLQRLFDETIKFLIEETNATIGYTQSDEITLILYNNQAPDSEVFFNGRCAKLTSVLASMATAKYNALVPEILPEKVGRLALFDCRVWTVPSEQEAVNTLIWRELDATRNSVQMVAQSLYSHKQLHQKGIKELQEMIFAKGINWNDYSDRCKKGGYFKRRSINRVFSTEEIEALPPEHEARKNPGLLVTRHVISEISMPPLLRVKNRIGVVFCGDEVEEDGKNDAI